MKKIDADFESNGLQHNVNPINEDFRSLLITTSEESSKISVETSRKINCEITSQVTNELDCARAIVLHRSSEV